MKESKFFTISRNAANMQRESIEIPSVCKSLHFEIKMPEICRYMTFLIVKDAAGQIRLQKLLGYGEQKIGIGQDSEHTTIGGVPGKIMSGEWQITLGVFTEYVAQRLGENQEEIEVVVTDAAEEITDSIGKWNWLEDGKGLTLSDEKYDWNQVYRAEDGWFKGDFHTHTRLSDGKETVENAMKKADMYDLDFYVPTEHNLMHTGWQETDKCILPGIEITTDKGHFNLFGIKKMPSKLYEIVEHNGDEQLDHLVRETICEAKKEGWLVSINHPFLTIWKWLYADTKLSDIDCMEIINDPTYPDGPAANEETLRYFDALWNDGHRITAVGGSDSHNLLEERYEQAEYPSVAGDPGTYVYCNQLTPNNLMSAVKAGRTVVTRFIRMIPKIQVGESVYYPGEEIPKENAKKISMHLDIMGDRKFFNESGCPQVMLVRNGKKIPMISVQTDSDKWTAEIEFSLSSQDCNKANGKTNLNCRACDKTVGETALNEEEWQWARVEIRGKDNMLLGITNPIYYGEKVSMYTTFGEVLQAND